MPVMEDYMEGRMMMTCQKYVPAMLVGGRPPPAPSPGPLLLENTLSTH